MLKVLYFKNCYEIMNKFEQPDRTDNLQELPLTADTAEEEERKTPLKIFKEFLQNVVGDNDEILTNNTHVI
uniref:Uncharacterized protein n=1 Tax=Glossina morsitans morsitans TaxID=37546 RepID=A0ABK9NG86_GLOMM